MSILYHPGKANVVVDALSRLSMGVPPTLKANVHKKRVLAFEHGGHGVLKYKGRLCVSRVYRLQERILEEAHN